MATVEKRYVDNRIYATDYFMIFIVLNIINYIIMYRIILVKAFVGVYNL